MNYEFKNIYNLKTELDNEQSTINNYVYTCVYCVLL